MSDASVGVVDQAEAGAANTKNVDTTELTRSDSTVVERQRVALGDATNPGFLASVDSAGRIRVVVDPTEIVIQLKRIALLLQILTNTEVSEVDVA